jgi:type VI secretion system secreted protein Hcp
MFDAYLKITGIPGESTSTGYEEQIEIVSYNHSISQPTSAVKSSSGGATTGRCEHGDFSIIKEVDKASPLLAQKCSDGTHIDEIVLTLCRAGGGDKKVPFMEYKMTEVVVANVAPAGRKDDLPLETISFNYGKIDWTYTQQKRKDGSGGGKTTGSWNLKTNAAK